MFGSAGIAQFTGEDNEGDFHNNSTTLNNCASHSRYFSDELDAQVFYIKMENGALLD